MIYYNNKWKPHTHIATFEDRGNPQEKYIHDKERWLEMEERHEHITAMSFESFELTSEQKERLDIINAINLPQGFSSVAREYVASGNVEEEWLPEDYNKPLGNLKLMLEQQEQDDYIDDTMQMLLEQEGLI